MGISPAVQRGCSSSTSAEGASRERKKRVDATTDWDTSRPRSHRRRRSEYGRFEIYLHGVASELIEEAVENGCSHIIFEDLRHIRENISQGDVATHLGVPTVVPIRRIQAAEHGIEAVQVPPNHTFQCCSTCGCTHEDNRDGEHFECLKCGYQNHADYNVAKDIGFRYLHRR